MTIAHNALDAIRVRLEALRQMTVENGCTEAEALTASVKMAELLARHGMTEEQLTALGFDQARVGIKSRRDHLETVWVAVSRFSECICWSSRDGDGSAIVYFGLPQNVLVARYVHDVLHRAYQGDLTRFKSSPHYTRRRLPKTRLQAVKAFTEGWASAVALKVIEGLWRRVGGPPKRLFELIDENAAKLMVAAETQGVSTHRSRALVKAKGDVKRDRALGQASGAQVQVHAGVRAAEVKGLLR